MMAWCLGGLRVAAILVKPVKMDILACDQVPLKIAEAVGQCLSPGYVLSV